MNCILKTSISLSIPCQITALLMQSRIEEFGVGVGVGIGIYGGGGEKAGGRKRRGGRMRGKQEREEE